MTDRGIATDVKKPPVCETVVWPLMAGCKMFKKKPGLTDRSVATVGYSILYGQWRVKEVMSAFSFAFEATQFVETEYATFLCVPCDLVYGHRSFIEKKRLSRTNIDRS